MYKVKFEGKKKKIQSWVEYLEIVVLMK